MAESASLLTHLQQRFAAAIIEATIVCDEVTVELHPDALHQVCLALRDETAFQFEQLIDVCGVDYAHYGLSEWETDRATGSGFERGVDVTQSKRVTEWHKPRFAVVYHLLSLTLNHRVRVKVFLEGATPIVDSIIDIWASADWFEREAFDLYGILFRNHPDLRRILTDYGFIGHPFRKDFPLIGNVEMRYDAAEQRVVYEPVSIEPRVLVPKTIRDDNRYLMPEGKSNG